MPNANPAGIAREVDTRVHYTPYPSINICITLECQKAHWSQHKQSCSSKAVAGIPNSLANPPRDEIIQAARTTMQFCNAYAKDPNYDYQNWMRVPPTLRNCMDFCRNTWETYWRKLLPGTIANEIRWMGVKEWMEQAAAGDRSLNRADWPPFNRETYEDAIGRNTLMALIIQTPDRYDAWGGPYDFSKEVWNVARSVTVYEPGHSS